MSKEPTNEKLDAMQVFIGIWRTGENVLDADAWSAQSSPQILRSIFATGFCDSQVCVFTDPKKQLQKG